MVLENYFQGNNGETENRLMDMERGEKRVRCMERVTWKLTFFFFSSILHIVMYLKNTSTIPSIP